MKAARHLPMLSHESHTFIEHVQGAFDPEILRSLRRYLENIQTERQAQTISIREKAAIIRGETSDAIRLDVRWFDPWRTAKPAFVKFLQPFSWIAYPVQVRMVREASHLVPWHLDLAYQKALGIRGHRQIITCFTPLDNDPSQRATVEFSRSEVPCLEHKPSAGFAAGILGQDFGQLVHFALRQGDCLAFGDLALHRTHIPVGAKLQRSSIEYRLIQPADALEDKDYFDIESGLFTRKDGTRRERP